MVTCTQEKLEEEPFLGLRKLGGTQPHARTTKQKDSYAQKCAKAGSLTPERHAQSAQECTQPCRGLRV